MAENEEITESNGSGAEEQAPIVKWNVEPDTPEVYTSLADAFKVVPQVVEQAVVEPIIEAEAIQEVPIEQEVIVAEANTSEYIELDEDYAIKFLADKKGMTVEEFNNSLKPNEIELDADVKSYLQYKKETNRSYTDWIETQKDYSQEPKDKVLLMNLKLENPTLNEKQIERLYTREYAFDPEYDDEDVVTDKEINIERDYQKGLAKLEAQKEQYKAVRGSDELVPEEYKNAKATVDNWNKQQEENQIVFEQTRQDFQAKTDTIFNPNFEGFKVKVGGQEFKVKPENIELAKNNLSDLSNFDKKFFDQSGRLKDPEGYYRALHFADNPDKIAEHFINIGRSLQAEDDEKESKNIQVLGQGNRGTPLVDSGRRFTIEKD